MLATNPNPARFDARGSIKTVAGRRTDLRVEASRSRASRRLEPKAARLRTNLAGLHNVHACNVILSRLERRSSRLEESKQDAYLPCPLTL